MTHRERAARRAAQSPTVTDLGLQQQAQPAAAAPASPFEVPPSKLGHFEVRGVLGKGAMGTVLEAYDPTLDRSVALKLLHDADRDDQRLLREAQALARLSHPNVVQVYEVGRFEERLFVAMELVEGQSLAQWQRSPRTWQECLHVYTQAGRGLAAAHAQGLVHRDFKPANCIIDAENHVRVLDFGLVREEGELIPAEPTGGVATGPADEVSAAISGSGSVLAVDLTRTGTVLGTLAYMAPEQLTGKPADARSDQFGFCVAFYEALYGRRPFRGQTAVSLLAAIHERNIVAVDRDAALPPVPAWLRRIVLRGLCAHRDERYPSMAALLDEIPRTLRKRRRIRGGLIGMGVATVGGLAAFAWPRPSPCDGLRTSSAPSWTPDARAAAEEGLLRVDEALAEPAWQGVQAHLDRYAAQWVEVRTEACEATHVRKTSGERTLELRLACLDRRSQRVEALVEQLANADREMVARAVEASHALPSIEPCRDARGLNVVEVGSVSDHDDGEPGSVRALIDRAWALHHTGRSSDALPLAEEAVERAGHDRIEAEAHYLRGSLHLDARALDPARRDLHVALEGAEHVRDEELVLDVLDRLVALELFDESHAAARAWLVQSRGKLPHAAEPPMRGVTVDLAEGRLASARGDHEAAVASMSRAIETLRKRSPRPELALARALQLLGGAESAGRRDAQARAAYAEGLELAERTGAHLTTARLSHDLAIHELEAGEIDRARQLFETALQIYESFFGERALIALDTRIGLVRVHMLRGDQSAALIHAQAARATLEGGDNVDPQSRALVMMMLGGLQQRAGDFENASTAYAQAREAFLVMPEVDEAEVAMAESSLGDCQRALAQLPAALRSYRRALDRLEAHAQPDDFRWVFPLLGLGRLQIARADPKSAVPLLRRALTIQEAGPHDPQTTAWIEWSLGRALHETRASGPEASELLHHAHATFSETGATDALEAMHSWRDECGGPCEALW